MYKHLIISILILSFNTFAQSPKEDLKLKTKLEATLKGFKGDVGIYVRNLKTNQFVAINADTIFPTASMVKVPIMIGTFDKIIKGELKYDQEIMY